MKSWLMWLVLAANAVALVSCTVIVFQDLEAHRPANVGR